MVGQALGLGRIAVAAQVGADHRVVARQGGRDLVPHGVRLGITVQHEHRSAIAAMNEIDGRAAGLDLSVCKTLEHQDLATRYTPTMMTPMPAMRIGVTASPSSHQASSALSAKPSDT